jgi:hypothetical protein
VVAIGGVVPVAPCRTAVPGVVVPRTATQHPETTRPVITLSQTFAALRLARGLFQVGEVYDGRPEISVSFHTIW